MERVENGASPSEWDEGSLIARGNVTIERVVRV